MRLPEKGSPPRTILCGMFAKDYFEDGNARKDHLFCKVRQGLTNEEVH